MSFRQDVGDTFKATALLTWIAVIVVVLGTGVGAWFLWLQPYFLTQERQNVTHSHQYIEAKRGLLVKLAQEYTDGEAEIARLAAQKKPEHEGVITGMQNQQTMLKARMREEAQNLPDNEIPTSVRPYIR